MSCHVRVNDDDVTAINLCFRSELLAKASLGFTMPEVKLLSVNDLTIWVKKCFDNNSEYGASLITVIFEELLKAIIGEYCFVLIDSETNHYLDI